MSGNWEWCNKHALSRDSGPVTKRLVGNLRKMPTKNPKTIGEALGTKGRRNPIESSSIKGKRGNREQKRRDKGRDGEKSKKETKN